MKLTDIIPIEDWMAIERKIVAQSGLDANIFDTNGRRISTFKHWANRLCPAIKDTDRGQSFICAVAHMNLAVMAGNTRQAQVEECDAGIAKIVVPIYVGEEYVGAFGACGKLLDDGEADSFMINRTTGIEEETVEELASDLETISSEQAQELVGYLEKKIREIVSKAG